MITKRIYRKWFMNNNTMIIWLMNFHTYESEKGSVAISAGFAGGSYAMPFAAAVAVTRGDIVGELELPPVNAFRRPDEAES